MNQTDYLTLWGVGWVEGLGVAVPIVGWFRVLGFTVLGLEVGGWLRVRGCTHGFKFRALRDQHLKP